MYKRANMGYPQPAATDQPAAVQSEPAPASTQESPPPPPPTVQGNMTVPSGQNTSPAPQKSRSALSTDMKKAMTTFNEFSNFIQQRTKMASMEKEAVKRTALIGEEFGNVIKKVLPQIEKNTSKSTGKLNEILNAQTRPNKTTGQQLIESAQSTVPVQGPQTGIAGSIGKRLDSSKVKAPKAPEGLPENISDTIGNATRNVIRNADTRPGWWGRNKNYVYTGAGAAALPTAGLAYMYNQAKPFIDMGNSFTQGYTEAAGHSPEFNGDSAKQFGRIAGAFNKGTLEGLKEIADLTGTSIKDVIAEYAPEFADYLTGELFENSGIKNWMWMLPAGALGAYGLYKGVFGGDNREAAYDAQLAQMNRMNQLMMQRQMYGR